jgi:hypothetical protein
MACARPPPRLHHAGSGGEHGVDLLCGLEHVVRCADLMKLIIMEYYYKLK